MGSREVVKKDEDEDEQCKTGVHILFHYLS